MGTITFDPDDLAATRAGLGLAIGTDVLAPSGSGANLTALNASNLSSGTVPTARLPAVGKVLQVVTTELDTTGSFSSSSTDAYADITGLAVAITPTATSSKILIFYNTVLASSVRATIHASLFRDSTKLGAANVSLRVGGSQAVLPTNAAIYPLEQHIFSYHYVDSPNTTSATTYQLKATLGASYSGSIYFNRTVNDTDASYGARSRSTITAMEIGA
jgi:hypothetical protein